MKKIKNLFSHFISKEGDKPVLNFKKITIYLAAIFGVSIIIYAGWSVFRDNSSIAYSNESVHKADNSKEAKQPKKSLVGKLFGQMKDSIKDNNNTNKGGHISKQENIRKKNINYKAQQVINRSENGKLKKGVPMGTHLIGKLLTTIDTRELGQLYKVLLPYGGRTSKSRSVPKNTILFGQATYSGKGNKVFLQFTKALLPDGKEVKISAQALNSKNYSPGLIGQFKGRATERIASAIGLTMVSAMTGTLTEKQALGNGEVVTPKANLKNALYQGLSKVSEVEASRQASALSDAQEYVTVRAGKEMIINLLSVFHIE